MVGTTNNGVGNHVNICRSQSWKIRTYVANTLDLIDCKEKRSTADLNHGQQTKGSLCPYQALRNS